MRVNKNKRNREWVEKILEEKPEHILAHTEQKQTKLLHNTIVDLDQWYKPRRGNYKIREKIESE